MINAPRGPTDEYLRSVEAERDQLRADLAACQRERDAAIADANKQFGESWAIARMVSERDKAVDALREGLEWLIDNTAVMADLSTERQDWIDALLCEHPKPEAPEGEVQDEGAG